MDKKVTYSKLIPLFTGLIFIGVVVCEIMCLINGIDASNVLIAVAASSAAIFGTSIVWYMKKAQAENVYKLDMGVFKEKSKIELEYIEKVLQLKREYSTNDSEIQEIKYNSDLDEMSQNNFQRIQNNVNTHMNDATSPIELQHF